VESLGLLPQLRLSEGGDLNTLVKWVGIATSKCIGCFTAIQPSLCCYPFVGRHAFRHTDMEVRAYEGIAWTSAGGVRWSVS
jgi:hypothetical protein